MPTFDELMSYSKAQTTKSENLAAELLAKRKQEEARRAKQQADAEKREKEMQEKLRKRHFEELQRQEQRKVEQERARQAREAEAKRREDEARDRLVKGRVPGQGASRSRHTFKDGGDGGGARKRAVDEGDGDSSMALTRQEKRERRLQADLNRTYGNMNGRSKTTGGYVRSGRKLPGGAVDRLSNGGSTDSANVRSAKERLAQMPNELRKLNTVKRDTRTIDEILQDRARAKNGQVLEGEKAKEFNDWFTPAKRASAPSNQTKPASTATKPLKPTAPTTKSMQSKSSYPSFSKSTSTSKPSKSSAPPTKPAKKRARSLTPPEDDNDGLFTDEDDYEDDDDLPPPPSSKRRALDAGASSIGDTIWSLFGKSRSSYVGRDVLSDDEDMEADARVLEAEERRSALQAKKEDMEALEEERRHDEEKRRRKKMMATRN